MTMKVLIVLVIVAVAVNAEVDYQAFLKQYGYLNNVGYSAVDSNTLSKALAKFQRMANLPVTGQLDESTRNKMKQPRCGASDISIRRNGYATQRWYKNQLTYRFLTFSNSLTSRKIREIISHAFRVWSDVTPLSFSETTSYNSDFTIGFYKRAHNDGYGFDGAGGVLAHAFFPTDGKVHFDEEERWVDGRTSNGNTNLFYTAAHEIGHAIGLEHMNNPKALMNPYHVDFGNRHGWRLPHYDVTRIQNIYGKGKGTGTGTGTGTGNGNCVNLDPSCEFFAGDNKCYDSQVGWYMKKNCRKACRFC